MSCVVFVMSFCPYTLQTACQKQHKYYNMKEKSNIYLHIISKI